MPSFIKSFIPPLQFSQRVEQLEEHSENDYQRLKGLEEMQKQQSKCLAAMLNHQITGNGDRKYEENKR